jgi:cysteine-rich repeat protein
MTTRPIVLVISVLCSMTLAAPVFAALTPTQQAQKCAAAKMKASANKFGAKAKCHAKALSLSAPVSTECLQKAEDKFSVVFDKLDTAGGCLHVGDGPAIEGKIDQTLSDIVGDLGCGNGVVEGDEQCDDGNLVDGDSCSATCVAGVAVCGNGFVDVGETCDDGPIDQAGCDKFCLVEAGYQCAGQPSACTPTDPCGNGVLSILDYCDDGNVNDGDGCSKYCHVEPGFSCANEPSVCVPYCGGGPGGMCMGDMDCCSNVCNAGICQ